MEQNSAFIKAFPITWILTAIVAIILWLSVDIKWAYSFVLGSATTLMMMSLLYKSNRKILQEQHPNASRLVMRNYAFRYFFYGLILIVSAISDQFEIFAVIIGLFGFKISLYLSLWMEKRGDSNA
jgi:1,4-dihydroxy-2-naphthoate octaprenyltransferase